MTRRTKQMVALLGGAALATLAWPGPSGAATSLGGYSGTAQAEVVRVQIYEPVIPLPASPQIDGGIAYAKSNTDTGPVSRATASYLWPGDVVGDGFNQLVGNEKANYPVQVNSRNPATADAPAQNTAQLTDGNGMTTSSTDDDTKATVTGLGIAGPGTDLLGGVGKGLGKLLGQKPGKTVPTPSLPVPVGKTLGGLVTLANVQSQTDVAVGAKTITSTAHTYASEIKLLGGLISIGSTDVTSQAVSDGKKATTSGSIVAGDIKVAGQDLGLDGKGIRLAGGAVKLPSIPSAVTSLLAKIGISVSYAPSTRTVDGATGSLASDGLVISIDTQPLKTALNVGGLVGPLQQLIQKIPQLGGQVAPLLGIGPKIVFLIGDVSSSATAAPAYVGGGGGTTTGGATTTGGGSVSTGGGSVGGGGASIGGASIGGTGSTGPTTGSSAPATTSQPTQSTGFDVPTLGNVPKGMILGAIALAVLVGWILRTFGGALLGTARKCVYGLPTGVPDLRKG